MTITSYAQNFEDVMLWRALGHIERGTYVDIGAQDPLIDSVSLVFYERGWKGIHVEPVPQYADMLRQQRQGDVVIQAAVGNGPAILKFYEIPGAGLSTGDAGIAAQHRERGFDVREIAVSCVSLTSVFDAAQAPEIHWLKIDVEGFEQQVLETWGESCVRPWVVVVESTLPMTQIQTHEAWESLVIMRGYAPVYFDGLNRYYVSDAHPELKDAFAVPPNVFDGFALNGTASAPYHAAIERRYQQRIDATLAQAGELQRQASEEAEQLSDSLAALRDAHAEHERQWAVREREISARLEASKHHATSLQRRAARDLNEQARQASEQQRALLSQQAEREQVYMSRERLYADSERAQAQQQAEFERQLQTARVALDDVVRERAASESALRQEAGRLQQRVEVLLTRQTQREQEVAAQVAAIHEQAAKARVDLELAHVEQQNALHRQHFARETALNEQLQTARDALEDVERERAASESALRQEAGCLQQRVETLLTKQTQREKEVAAQVAAIHEQAAQARVDFDLAHVEQQNALRRQHFAREVALNEQLQAARDALDDVERERAASESALRQEAGCLQQRVETLLTKQTQREQEVAAQVAVIHEQAAQARVDLELAHMEQQNALHRQHFARETAMSEQLQIAQREIRRIADESAARERALAGRYSEARGLLEDALHAQVQRELAIGAQLLAAERKGAQERAELIRQHDERSEAQRSLEAGRKAARAQEEQALNAQIIGLRGEIVDLRHAKALQDQRHDADTRARDAAHDHLVKTYSAAETRLRGELLAEQQMVAKLRESLTDVRQRLAATHTSFSWRITAPLRALFSAPTDTTATPVAQPQAATPDAAESQPVEAPQAVAPAYRAESEFVAQAHSPAHTDPHAIDDRPTSFEATMISLIQAGVSGPVATLDVLLAHHDQPFVQCAYQTLLGRDPDQEGLAYYLRRVRSGETKIQILAQLRYSAEGRAASVDLPGLDAAIERHRKARRPVTGWLYRLFTGVEGNRAYERRLRGIENQLLVLGDESARRFGQLESALAGLQEIFGQQAQTLAAAWQRQAQGEGQAAPLAQAAAVMVEQPAPELEGLSPRARALHAQLKRATTIQLGKVA